MNGPTVTNYRNPVAVSSDGSVIDLEINTEEYGWIPTTVNLDEEDKHGHVVQIKEWLNANKALVAPYTPPSEEERAAEEAGRIRAERDSLLQQADILVNKARDLGSDAAPYRAYRQALRDVPSQEGFPYDIVWPAQPPEPAAAA